MGPFPSSRGYENILVEVFNMSHCVDVFAIQSSDSKVVVKFICKHIFSKFGTARAMTSDGGTHFINNLVHNFLA